MLLVTMLVMTLTCVIVYVYECKVSRKKLAPKYPKVIATIIVNFGLVQIHDEQLKN